jgi:hypothetical protein
MSNEGDIDEGRGSRPFLMCDDVYPKFSFLVLD